MYALRINRKCSKCGEHMKLNFKSVKELKDFYANDNGLCDRCSCAELDKHDFIEFNWLNDWRSVHD